MVSRRKYPVGSKVKIIKSKGDKWACIEFNINKETEITEHVKDSGRMVIVKCMKESKCDGCIEFQTFEIDIRNICHVGELLEFRPMMMFPEDNYAN